MIEKKLPGLFLGLLVLSVLSYARLSITFLMRLDQGGQSIRNNPATRFCAQHVKEVTRHCA